MFRSRNGYFAVFACLLFVMPCRPTHVHAYDGTKLGDLRAYFSKIYPENEPGAAVIVVREGRILFAGGYGLADLEWNLPVGRSTVFRLGSISKQFTAVAVLMLVQEGRVRLDSRVSEILPGLIPEQAKDITLEHLLTHTSGLVGYPNTAVYDRMKCADLEKPEVLGIFLQAPLDFEPGTAWMYSDSGYFLLGQVVEALSGLRYEDFVRSRILSPLGMRHTFYDEPGRLILHRARGYIRASGAYGAAPCLSSSFTYAAGGYFSTVDDLAKWDAALYGEKLVKQSLLQRSFVPYHLRDGAETFYGYAWAMSNVAGTRIAEHGGRIAGFEGHVLRVPSERIFVAVLGNSIGHEPSPEFVATRVALTVLGRLRTPVKERLPSDLLQSYVGSYQGADGIARCIELVGGNLSVRRSGQGSQSIFSNEGDEFYFENSFNRIDFMRDKTNVVVGLLLKPKFGEPAVAKKVSNYCAF